MQHECRPLAKGLLHIEHPKRQLLGELVYHLEYILTVHRNLLKFIEIHDCRQLLTLTCIRVSVSVPGADNIIGTKVFQAIILQQIFIHKTALDVFLWLQTRSVFGTYLTHDSTLLHK